MKCETPGCENTDAEGRRIYECDECGGNVCSDYSEEFYSFHEPGVRCVDGKHVRPEELP
jgi:hypothetical protein